MRKSFESNSGSRRHLITPYSRIGSTMSPSVRQKSEVFQRGISVCGEVESAGHIPPPNRIAAALRA